MNIDFIKWMCEKAEGFKVFVFPNITQVQIPFYEHLKNLDGVEQYICKDRWSLLYQKAIEGVNNENGSIVIMYYGAYFEIHSRNSGSYKTLYLDDFDSIDQAKESALKYIWEQEAKC